MFTQSGQLYSKVQKMSHAKNKTHQADSLDTLLFRLNKNACNIINHGIKLLRLIIFFVLKKKK